MEVECIFDIDDWETKAFKPFLTCDPISLQTMAEYIRLAASGREPLCIVGFGPPIEDDFKPLIVHAIKTFFMATFELDEGNFYPFRATIILDGAVPPDLLEFNKNLNLNEKNISKLAPTLNFEKSIILQAVSGELKIRGLGNSSCAGIRLSSDKPASIFVSLVSESKTTKMFQVTSRGIYTLPGLRDCPGALESLAMAGEEPEVLECRLESLSEILRRLYVFKRGAAIVVAKSEAWKSIVQPENKYRLKSRGYLGVNQDTNNRGRGNHDGSHLIDLAAYSRIDGATVVDQNLNLLEFGAKLRTLNADSQVETYLSHDLMLPMIGTMKETTKNITEIGGMRHRSAAQAVFDGKGEVTIVVASEDGPMTLLFWDGSQVVAVKGTEGIFL